MCRIDVVRVLQILNICCFVAYVVMECFRIALQLSVSHKAYKNDPPVELNIFLFHLIVVAEMYQAEVKCGECTLACFYKIYAAVCLQYFVCS